MPLRRRCALARKSEFSQIRKKGTTRDSSDRMLACCFVLSSLAFVRGKLEQSDGGQNGKRRKASNYVGCASGQVTDGKRQQAKRGTQRIHKQNRGPLALTQIREAVRSMVFSWSREGKKAAPGARNGNQRGVKDCCTEDEDRNEPCGLVTDGHDGPQLQSQGCHH